MKAQFRKKIEQMRWLRYVPNALTIGNSLCGFTAILVTLAADEGPHPSTEMFGAAACIILFALFFDTLDGFTARMFNAASMHGMQMDSLSDMVSFGVAPAVLVAVLVHRVRGLSGSSFIWLWIFCAMYLSCVALRLATYNVHTLLEKKNSEKFLGLPAPAAAAAICSLVLLYASNAVDLGNILIILPPYVAIISLLMISKVQYEHMGRWLQSVKRNNRRLFLLILVTALMIKSPLHSIVVLVNGYVVSGIALHIIRTRTLRRQPLPHKL